MVLKKLKLDLGAFKFGHLWYSVLYFLNNKISCFNFILPITIEWQNDVLPFAKDTVLQKIRTYTRDFGIVCMSKEVNLEVSRHN